MSPWCRIIRLAAWHRLRRAVKWRLPELSVYELDLSVLNDEDRAEVKRQTALYKQVRQLLLDGDLYRLRSPFESNEAAWIMVSPPGKRRWSPM